MNVIDATVMLISSIFTSISQAPKCPPLVLAAGLGQLATVQQLIRDGEGTLEDCDEVCLHMHAYIVSLLCPALMKV